MTYKQVKDLKPEVFKRLCGVGPETFTQMVSVLEQWEKHKRKPGRPSKLSLQDQVMMTLEYWREYRTYFHMAHSWGIDESTACRIISKVENLLIQCEQFRLPGKKKLQDPEHEIEVIVVDVTESPIERPQKNKSASTAARSEDIPSNPR